MSAGWDYEQIKAEAKKLGKKVTELIALARQHDPFYCGQPRQRLSAEWFARMWREHYDGRTGISLRSIHYRLFSVKYLKENSEKYALSKKDSAYLNESSKSARLLGLVPIDAIDDSSTEPIDGLASWKKADERVPALFNAAEGDRDWRLPTFLMSFPSWRWTLDAPSVDGYDPDDFIDRAFYMELWIEKATMDAILRPLAKEFGVTYVSSQGYQSIPSVVRLLNRTRELGKPSRVFYISDHDNSGNAMPCAVARQIEFWLPQIVPGADVKLIPLALTTEQIARYKLPWVVSEKTGRKTVELDALEAYVPGELEKIVRRAIEPYRDAYIGERLALAKKEAEQIIQDEWARDMGPHQRKLLAIQKSVEAVMRNYGPEIEKLNRRLDRDLTPFKKALAKLKAKADQDSEGFYPELPERPTEVCEPDEGEPLFDSKRDYLTQLPFYKAHRKG